jgi:hypothetical protein
VYWKKIYIVIPVSSTLPKDGLPAPSERVFFARSLADPALEVSAPDACRRGSNGALINPLGQFLRAFLALAVTIHQQTCDIAGKQGKFDHF